MNSDAHAHWILTARKNIDQTLLVEFRYKYNNLAYKQVCFSVLGSELYSWETLPNKCTSFLMDLVVKA